MITKPAYAAITNPALPQFGTPDQGGAGLAFYISQMWKATVVIGGLAFLIYLLYAGVTWVTAGGDPKRVEQSQKAITNGFVGLTILVASYAIIAFLQDVLNFNILNIDWTFGN